MFDYLFLPKQFTKQSNTNWKTNAILQTIIYSTRYSIIWIKSMWDMKQQFKINWQLKASFHWENCHNGARVILSCMYTCDSTVTIYSQNDN